MTTTTDWFVSFSEFFKVVLRWCIEGIAFTDSGAAVAAYGRHAQIQVGNVSA